MAGHPGPRSTCGTGGWTSCASCREDTYRTASGRSSGPRVFQPQKIGVTSQGGTFWAGGLRRGTPEPPPCLQGLQGRPERQKGSRAWGWSLSQARISPQGWWLARLGPGPLWLLWSEAEGGRDSASGLEPVVSRGVAQGMGIPSLPCPLSVALCPAVEGGNWTGGFGEGGHVYLSVFNVPGTP